MKTTLQLLAALAVTGLAYGVAAETIQVDFGAEGGAFQPADPPASNINDTTSEGGTTWNGVEPGISGFDLAAGTTQDFLDLVDSDGNATAVDLALTWTNSAGLDFSRAWDLHPGDRDGDYLGVRGDNAGVFNTITFSSLTNGLYDITVWTQAPTDFRVDGGTVEVVPGSGSNVGPGNNTGGVVSFTFEDVNVADGDVAIDWGHISSVRGADQWATVTAVSLTQVPEPGSLALLGLGGLLVARRRRSA